MKKLKPWQKVLLIVFYPVGIIYFIIWLCNRNKQPATGAAPVMRVDMNKLAVVQDFHTKVVGVTFGNDDGSSRQEIIKGCKVGEDIIFKPVPTKDYPDAIGVFNMRGQQLGHINAELAAELKEKYGANPMSVTINNITGGDDKNYGCNLHIIIYSHAENNSYHDLVFVNKGSKVYHSDQMCAMSRSVDCIEMKESEAIKRGLRRCSKCYGNFN